MARQKKDKSGKGKGKDNKPVAQKTTETAPAEVATSQVVKTLPVEIRFPIITDLKQAIGMDNDGNLNLAIQFKSRVDQFEIFRLVNLLKQPHTLLYAVIGSPQSAMDFQFTKDGRIEIIEAINRSEVKGVFAIDDKGIAESINIEDKPVQTEDVKTQEPKPAIIKFEEVKFNHIPEDLLPYGVFSDFIVEGGEVKSGGGRGNNPTEAVIDLAINTGLIYHNGKDGKDEVQIFEVREVLDKLEPSPANYKLIRVLDVGEFDAEYEGEDQATKGA